VVVPDTVEEVGGFLGFRVGLGLGLRGGRVEEDDNHGGTGASAGCGRWSAAGGGGGRRLGLGIWVTWVWGVPIADGLRCWSGAAVAADCGRRGQAATAPPTGWWRISDEQCWRRGQTAAVVRKCRAAGWGREVGTAAHR
jgi:hypothetical protein